MNWKTLFLAAAMTAGALQPALALEDPAPKAYGEALAGKRVMLVPMAMGFDLAQGWEAYLKREIDAFGGILETRDPNWSVEAGAQAITEAISATQKPDVLIVMSPDLNSYSKLMNRAQQAGIYVILVDNPANFKADVFTGPDWTELGRLEAEAVVKGCGEGSSKKIGLVQGDQVNATSLFQYAGIMEVLAKYPDFQVVAKPDSNWDATTSRNVTTTMLQQNPDICGIIDFWDGDATGAAAAIRDAGKQDQVYLVTTGGGEQTADCDRLADGTFDAVVMTELPTESANMVAMIKYLLQSGQKPGTSSAYLYSLLKATTKDDLTPTSCWSLQHVRAEAGIQ
ncbi:sugar ABC transporter substrate-binding protein [Paenirhodobacter populi]|uniref:Sugar ABC transporter substrate-binding protein n=1 Tax=Paenirhodobacter populi TaxID=2306993 RepID=A0A443JF99_9RHOB|nr:sugar ABC transporter substrate-binding protein [Sinirhodobacter populi]RWR07236.1 sugar ABC transporter substrate-binding protein [Sinirhodobacter populi]RWR07383.1 sugar ABC transporter substrate-binding protein [Sinirhodobacter populi]RWR19239.1 sugar ABC transporter substrate-binding protein [Sinirhodobacter populi]RWR27889.1 sugar ABC transporter substrate-binding protein [Sinirhodobacter populi]RWR28308.1 sugar ABC transporter substrate-binding protein [Sinirhodobacter populi]